jgi:hypothetical protein
MSNIGGLFFPASATPMFNGALTEWFPTLGASSQVPQKPGMLGWLSASFNPATPMMLIIVVLNNSSPRAMLGAAHSGRHPRADGSICCRGRIPPR